MRWLWFAYTDKYVNKSNFSKQTNERDIKWNFSNQKKKLFVVTFASQIIAIGNV